MCQSVTGRRQQDARRKQSYDMARVRQTTDPCNHAHMVDSDVPPGPIGFFFHHLFGRSREKITKQGAVPPAPPLAPPIRERVKSFEDLSTPDYQVVISLHARSVRFYFRLSLTTTTTTTTTNTNPYRKPKAVENEVTETCYHSTMRKHQVHRQRRRIGRTVLRRKPRRHTLLTRQKGPAARMALRQVVGQSAR